MRQQLEEQVDQWSSLLDNNESTTSTEAYQAWEQYEAVTRSLSHELCEQLRLILEPTQAAKLRHVQISPLLCSHPSVLCLLFYPPFLLSAHPFPSALIFLSRPFSPRVAVTNPASSLGVTVFCRGDYRTGKRLNMRKVIAYIASQFRKDKIWLRRSEPSKRQYQIAIAVDDSSSMEDNHSKQLAFEALACISNALNFLQAGDMSIVR